MLGIRKRAELGPEERERRRALGKRLALAAESANATGAASRPLPGKTEILDANPPPELRHRLKVSQFEFGWLMHWQVGRLLP